jgi:hypothetical protein
MPGCLALHHRGCYHMHCWYLTIPTFTRNAGWPRRICPIRNRPPQERSPGRCETGTGMVTSGHIRTRQYLAAASGSSSRYEDILIIHDPISTLSPFLAGGKDCSRSPFQKLPFHRNWKASYPSHMPPVQGKTDPHGQGNTQDRV